MLKGYQVCQVRYLDKGGYTTGTVPRMLESVDEKEHIKDISEEEDTKEDNISNGSKEEKDVKDEYIDWGKGIGKANEADMKDGEDPIPAESTRLVPLRKRIYLEMVFPRMSRYASNRSSTMFYHFKEACINGATLTPGEEDQADAELGAAHGGE
ncbi:hypothetical protein BGZ51_008090 [Haplosporangium sp. Z 767]|nr:hypothetical protein BGZ51_008090 [Haplosporangium sp. Z 767]